MREDDKEIVKFISEKGGQVFESDLRKKFLQPRTTMWRAVKRLEREGIVKNIIFPSGTAVFDDRLYIYYGAADTCVATAEVPINELLNELTNLKSDQNAKRLA